MAQRNALEWDFGQVGAREQQRIGLELHDGVGQELTGLGYLAHSLHQKLLTKSPEEAATAAELASSIPATLAKIRRIVKGLVPVEIGSDDLALALEDLMAGFEEQTGIRCRFESLGDFRFDNNSSAIQLYRVAQEAVTNAVKHADARHIVVTLGSHGDQVRLEVRDDGVGMRSSAETATGCGLAPSCDTVPER